MAANDDVIRDRGSAQHPGNQYWNQLVRAGAMLFEQSNAEKKMAAQSNVEKKIPPWIVIL